VIEPSMQLAKPLRGEQRRWQFRGISAMMLLTFVSRLGGDAPAGAPTFAVHD